MNGVVGCRVEVAEPIGVLCGGPSAERAISLRSGQAVWQALQGLGYNVHLLELPAQGHVAALKAASWPEGRGGASASAGRIRTAFIALHGAFGEDGEVQALLESLGIPYTGSGVAASRLAFDKAAAKARLQAAGVPVPRGVTMSPGAELSAGTALWPVVGTVPALNGLGLPLIVKPSRQGSSIGVTIVDNVHDWPAALAEAGRYDATVLCEEYLDGPELTVGILDDAPLPVVQVVPRRRCYDYVAKYTPGMTDYLVPAPVAPAVTAQVHALAQAAHRALACRGFSRVDCIMSAARGPVVLEVNTVPGLTATSLLPKAAAAAGLSFEQLCERLLASARQDKDSTERRFYGAT